MCDRVVYIGKVENSFRGDKIKLFLKTLSFIQVCLQLASLILISLIIWVRRNDFKLNMSVRTTLVAPSCQHLFLGSRCWVRLFLPRDIKERVCSLRSNIISESTYITVSPLVGLRCQTYFQETPYTIDFPVWWKLSLPSNWLLHIPTRVRQAEQVSSVQPDHCNWWDEQ